MKECNTFETLYWDTLIAEILKQYDFEIPEGRSHTFTQITEYVIFHLPNLKNAQQLSTADASEYSHV
jgi:hypothetical protein